MSCLMRIPAFCPTKNKGPDQLRHCFRIPKNVFFHDVAHLFSTLVLRIGCIRLSVPGHCSPFYFLITCVRFLFQIGF